MSLHRLQVGEMSVILLEVFFTFAVGDDAREDDPVCETLRFVLRLRHECLYLQYLHRRVTATRVPSNVN